ncbi:cytochrome P450 306a1 [Ischnura elegans]|uniref:cytochrome P450 306a1 n=1 Tax=Ischnura elegans TaxID=197161 RepID=UPI001ED89DE7|nr:cytochrome P450 306a1 [Ischnura elegans]
MSLADTWRNLPLPDRALAVAAILLAFAATRVALRGSAWWCGGRGGRLPLPPGPWCLPVVGYLPFLDPRAPHRSLAELAARWRAEGVLGVWLGSVYAVVVTDPRLVREALSREEFAGRAPLYLTHGIMKGHGIICAEGERWKTSRRFASSFLKTLGMVRFPGPRRDALERRIMVAVKECIQGFQEQMEGKEHGDESVGVGLNPLPELLHGIGNLMSDLVFGKTWSRHDQTWKWLQSLQEEGTKLIGVAGPLNFLPFLRFIPYYKKTMDYLMEGKLKTHDLYRKFILEHLESKDLPEGNDMSGMTGIKEEEFEGMDISDEEAIHSKRRGAKDAIDAYVTQNFAGKQDGEYEDYSEDSRQLANDTQLHHLLADLFGAGLDTTLATLRWFLLFVGVHPLVQNKIQEELDNVLGRESLRRPVSMCDSGSLPYLEATISETQRIRPVVPLGIPHGALKDTTLGGYRIPRGSMIVPLQWVLHNDESTWGPKAEKVFDPTRFLDEDGNFNCRKFQSFMPFQSGRRVCVGEELAHMLLLLFGASILHEFRLSLAGDLATDDVLEGESGITLTPKPHRLVFRRRFPFNPEERRIE